MSLDINALKERLQGLNRRVAKANDIWKPSDEHTVRLVPYTHGEDPFLELHFHYDVGDRPVLCPNMNYGEDCAICEGIEPLKAWKNASGEDKRESERKQDWEMYKKVQAKARVFVPMIERGKEKDGAKFWGVTPHQAVEILAVCADGDRLSELDIDKDDTKRALQVIINPDKAYDLTVSFKKPGEKGNTKNFTQVDIKGKIRPTPLSKDKAEVQAILASVKNIKEVYPPTSAADVKRAWEKFVGGGSAPALPEGGTEKYSAPTGEVKSKEDSRISGTRSIDEAFGDLLND